LLHKFEADYYESLEEGISLNPILNAFQQTVHTYQISNDLVKSFLKSMKADLYKTTYKTKEAYDSYIYGSADVVGLMCLKVFVNGDAEKFEELKAPAMRLGSAFQKVNFLRDLKDDLENLDRSYFPNINLKELNNESKNLIIKEIEEDFEVAFKEGILKLPVEAKFGVYIAYRYYKKLLKKLKSTPSSEIMETRIRISNTMKINLLARSFVKYKLKLI
jgi:phytoene/squalene synthetase